MTEASTDMTQKSTIGKPSRRVGLLGGSFNPAHEGHLHISREALKRLNLSEVWWLVSPKNPLKASSELAPYLKRLESARAIATDRRIRVHNIESTHHLHYTVDSLRWLKRHYPKTQFVWLMGADNLSHFHRWVQWREIARMVPIAILDRAPYAYPGLHGRFAQRLKYARFAPALSRKLADFKAPAWVYLIIPRADISATSIRKRLGRDAFVRHNEETI